MATDKQPVAARATAPLFAIAALMTLLHVATNARYGFHRDELQFLTDARHLDFGFVAYPPLTPLIERFSMTLFGLSLVGLRLASVLAQAAAIVLAGLMAREFGGRRLAQLTAAGCVALSALPIFEGTEFQYSSFDFLWWVLIAYFLAKLLRTGDGRWWLATGAAIGVALETKYTICFLIAGLLGGMAFTPARRWFATRWFWFGVAVALVIFLPNFIWQVRHGFISIHFLQHIHQRDVGQGRADGFLWQQFVICASTAATPLWIAGLIAFLRTARLRLFAWMYLIPFALFLFGGGRSYYLAGAYPMLFTMGAVAAERWLTAMPRPKRVAIAGSFFALVAIAGAYFIAILVPVASAGPLRTFALAHNGDLREEIGWDELVDRVADLRDALPAAQQRSFGVLAGNYGEAGAIEILGPRRGLPKPIGTTNSAWLRGFPAPQPATLVVLGYSREDVERDFVDCRFAGMETNREGISNEESRGHDLFVCGPPKLGWAAFWRTHQRFG